MGRPNTDNPNLAVHQRHCDLVGVDEPGVDADGRVLELPGAVIDPEFPALEGPVTLMVTD